MLIQLADIIDEPFHWAETTSIEASSLGRNLLVGLGRISWTGEVSRASKGHLLTCRLEYEQKLTCSRCLEPTPMSVAADVRLLLQSRGSEPTLGEVELENEDLDVFYVDGDELDTELILIEQVQLNIPMRELCREDCRGLCPMCGSDRNQEKCGCEESPIDARWEALKNLRVSDE